jgi:hypothetical protein
VGQAGRGVNDKGISRKLQKNYYEIYEKIEREITPEVVAAVGKELEVFFRVLGLEGLAGRNLGAAAVHLEGADSSNKNLKNRFSNWWRGEIIVDVFANRAWRNIMVKRGLCLDVGMLADRWDCGLEHHRSDTLETALTPSTHTLIHTTLL